MMLEKKEKLYKTSIGMSWVATRLIQNKIQLEIQKLYKDINFEQVLVLMELDYEDGVRPSVLADRLQRSKGTMTSLVRHAEKNELVACSQDPTNRNAKRVFLTLKGKRVHDELALVFHKELSFATEGLSEEEQKVIFTTMEKIVLKYRPEYYNY